MWEIRIVTGPWRRVQREVNKLCAEDEWEPWEVTTATHGGATTEYNIYLRRYKDNL